MKQTDTKKRIECRGLTAGYAGVEPEIRRRMQTRAMVLRAAIMVANLNVIMLPPD
jgi:ribosomal protein S6E (S10)